MSCELVRDKLADFATGRLAADEAAAVRGHVDKCGDCRDFADTVRSLYAIEMAEEDVTAPTALNFAPRVAPLRTTRHRLARAAAMAAAALVLIVLALQIRGRVDGRRSEEPTRPAGPIDLGLPVLPGPWLADRWLDDEDEARLLAAYTGLPVLRQHAFALCPRCIGVDPELSSPTTLAHLGDFICLKLPIVIESIDDRLLAAGPRIPPQFMSPVLFVDGVQGTFGPVWEVGSLARALDFAAEYRRSIDATAPRPLDRSEFDRCVAERRRIEEHLSLGELDAAQALLERHANLAPKRRTRFAADASAALRRLEEIRAKH